MIEVSIIVDDRECEAARRLAYQFDSPFARQALVDAAGSGLVNVLRRHFAAREKEPHSNIGGFPKFGVDFPKKYFWYGNRGSSVAEQIQPARVKPEQLAGTVSIKSAPLAHRLARNPAPIKPKGGKKYLAVPASPEAARFDGLARVFPGGLKFGYALADGRFIPALFSAKFKSGRSGGASSPLYFLIRQARQQHDPRALPTPAEQHSAVMAAVRTAISRIIQNTNPDLTH